MSLLVRSAGRLIVTAILGSFVAPPMLAAENREDATGENVSIIQLVANPQRYHGKVVVVAAYATVEPENSSLCMTRNPASHKDCIWLEYDDAPSNSPTDMQKLKRTKAAWSKMNGHRVTVRGTFNQDNTGHFGGWSGAIESISDYWPD